MKKALFKNSTLSPILSVAYNIALIYAVYAICRYVYFAVNKSFFPEVEASDLAQLFEAGLLFDTSAIIYTNILYILLMLLPFHGKAGIMRNQISKWLYLVVNGICIIVNLADSVYFTYTNRRTTATVFSQFGNEDNIAGIIGMEIWHNIPLLLLAIALIFALYKLYTNPNVSNIKHKVHFYTANIAALLVAAPLCLFGMRGGIGAQTRPITISNANEFTDNPIETGIILNTPFSLIRTLGKKAFVTPNYFPNEQEMEAVFTPLHMPADTVMFRPKNVVIFIMESFGKEYIGALNKNLDGGRYKGYTPFLDSLISKSLTFEYSYANGRKSIDGMPSILSGIPMFVEPFFLTPASLNHVSSIGGELRKKGYYTAFFHGAQNSSMGFHAYSRASGVEGYYGRSEYNNDKDFDGRWAIWDEEFFQFYERKISTFREPFMTALFSASSHHPFKIPERYEGRFPEGTLPIHKCIGYSDNALRRFFEKAQHEPWFENTLFVITADHTNQTEHEEYMTMDGIFSVPIIFYTPNGDLRGLSKSIAQQIDIMPTVLGYLGYDKPYMAFGCDLLHTPPADTYMVSYVNDSYLYMKGDYLLVFNGDKVTGVYNFKKDPLLKANLHGKTSEEKNLEKELKAIIQQYMSRMNTDRIMYREASDTLPA